MVKVKVDKLIEIYERYSNDYLRFMRYDKEINKKPSQKHIDTSIKISGILKKLKFFKEDTNVLFLPANRYYKLCKVAVDLDIFED